MIGRRAIAVRSHMTGRIRLSYRRLADVCEYLSAMLNARLTLTESLDECSVAHDGTAVGRFSSQLSVALRGGASLSTALGSIAPRLPAFLCRLLTAAERAGSLEDSLREAAALLREGTRVRSVLLGAAAYPFAVLLFLLASMAALQFLLAPDGLFGVASLPEHLLSRLDAIRATARTEFVMIGLVVTVPPFAGFCLLRLRTTEGPLESFADRVVLAVPFAGRLIATRELRLFIIVLQAFTARGVSVEAALDEAADLLHGYRLRRAFRSAIRQIQEGYPAALALASEPAIPAPIRRSVAVGDRTGSLAGTLPALAEHYRWESERAVHHLEELAEPLLITLCGSVMLVVALTVVIPLLTLFGEAV